MDWREEIMNVARQIRWLPESIDGLARELEWLTNMRDWMISKKRFWGLALPIWVDDETGDFEVIGSLAELEKRAVSGWNEFAGHTPHRPWIDRVRIANPRTGNTMSRIADVGNPWLDAGIVPFSTLEYNTSRDNWKKWYPADLVTECFPGQFRNWFYSMLSMATMIDNSPPFKTLLGHRLVMNEDGRPMHKSDGTAIWFEEAAEQLGVDTMRWLYLAQNPAADLRFGRRHPDTPVTLETPEGPIQQTAEGQPTCEVVSRPADEARRQVLIPLWNTYAFFVNYARLDGFDPRDAAVPVPERPEIDRWIVSNLEALVETAHRAMGGFDAPAFLREAARFIDDLSNWYVRRNRRRFWRSRDSGDHDKLAAYQTLYEVLLSLTKLLAPMIPFVCERMYRNLVPLAGPGVPESVHLCDYPQPDPARRDPQLSRRMELAQRVVNLGHGLRERASVRVRQPLPELRFACGAPEERRAIESLADIIREELNVKTLTGCEHLDDLVHYEYKPNLKTLGPRFGKGLAVISRALPAVDARVLAPLRRGESVTLVLEGSQYLLAPEDVLVSTRQAADWVAADDRGVQVALSTVVSPALRREGMARDFVRQVQQLRKEADLEIECRISIGYAAADPEVISAVDEWGGYIRSETLADGLARSGKPAGHAKPGLVGEVEVPIWIETVLPRPAT
jgi:isoleucyl-tRNA synthetase